MNYKNIVGMDNVFISTPAVVAGRTYVVILARDNLRTLTAFTIDSTGDDNQGPFTVRFAVLYYQTLTTSDESSGFNWTARNHPGTPQQCAAH